MTQPSPVRTASRRWLFVVAGWAVLVVAVIGVFLPLVPTTPLVLVAAWCFSRGSARLHRWLLEHRWFGPPIRDWEAHGMIPLPAKLFATAMVVGVVTMMIVTRTGPLLSRIATVLLAAWGLTVVWSRPSTSS